MNPIDESRGRTRPDRDLTDFLLRSNATPGTISKRSTSAQWLKTLSPMGSANPRFTADQFRSGFNLDKLYTAIWKQTWINDSFAIAQ